MPTLIRLDQIRRAGSPTASESEAEFALGRYFEADCAVSDVVGAFVNISGASVGGVYQVETVDPRDPTKMPALGVIISKSTLTSCLVHVGPGVVSAFVLGTGLIPQKRYFVGLNGLISSTLPTALLGGLALIQVVGHALDSSNLLLIPNYGLMARRG